MSGRGYHLAGVFVAGMRAVLSGCAGAGSLAMWLASAALNGCTWAGALSTPPACVCRWVGAPELNGRLSGRSYNLAGVLMGRRARCSAGTYAGALGRDARR